MRVLIAKSLPTLVYFSVVLDFSLFFRFMLSRLLWYTGFGVYIDASSGFKVLSLIVNGLGSDIKRSKVITKMKRERGDILFWQETHLSTPEHEKLKKMGYRNSFFFFLQNG